MSGLSITIPQMIKDALHILVAIWPILDAILEVVKCERNQHGKKRLRLTRGRWELQTQVIGDILQGQLMPAFY